jgi:anthranilate synthase/aminodeoxychorismate synthase-like glutamine amidotransferase
LSNIAFIDHYDSFSFNVLDWLINAGFLPESITHVYYDDDSKMKKLFAEAQPLVFGPGPNSPKEVPNSGRLAAKWLGKVPILGLCLGHQILGSLGVESIIQAKNPWHGTKRRISKIAESFIFKGLPDSFDAAVYHSLVVDGKISLKNWKTIALDNDQEIMAMEWSGQGAPAWGLQFHPESFLSECGFQIGQNWYEACANYAVPTAPLSMPS